MSFFIFLKDLAGPLATVAASGAAAFVTFRIQDENRRIKREELRLALFERRYKIYSSTVEYIRYVRFISVRDKEDEIPKSQAFARLVVESGFTCGTEVERQLEKIRSACFANLTAFDELTDASNAEERNIAICKRREASNTIDDLLADLPTVFKHDLKLKFEV